MNEQIAQSFWTLIHQYEDLLQGDHYREIPSCPEHLGHLLSPKEDSLQMVERQIEECILCTLHESASEPIPGNGSSNAKLFVLTSSPSQEDDKYGQIMFGEDGDYFEKWISSIGLDKKNDCYFSALVRCITPGERSPLHNEQLQCMNYLNREVQIVKPKMIVTLGPMVYSALTQIPAYGFEGALSAVCMASPQRIHHELATYLGIPVVPLYHPKEVLANPVLRRRVWSIVKRMADLLD